MHMKFDIANLVTKILKLKRDSRIHIVALNYTGLGTQPRELAIASYNFILRLIAQVGKQGGNWCIQDGHHSTVWHLIHFRKGCI